MVPPWLHALAIASLTIAMISAARLAFDLMRHPQKMWIMNVVWPVTALYFGPLTLWLYDRYGRLSAKDAPSRGDEEAATAEQDPIRKAEVRTGKPFWAIIALGVTHCGAGCTLGDIIAECGLFFTGTMLAGSQLDTFLVGDYMMAYALGIAFQYFTIAPMRGISGVKGIWAAVKADTLSLTAFEVGLFAWMWAMSVVFKPELKPDEPTYWFNMQIGMVLGFLTAYPMNWWLTKAGLKEAM